MCNWYLVTRVLLAAVLIIQLTYTQWPCRSLARPDISPISTAPNDHLYPIWRLVWYGLADGQLNSVHACTTGRPFPTYVYTRSSHVSVMHLRVCLSACLCLWLPTDTLDWIHVAAASMLLQHQFKCPRIFQNIIPRFPTHWRMVTICTGNAKELSACSVQFV